MYFLLIFLSVNTTGKRHALNGEWKIVVEDQSASVTIN